MVNRRLRSGTGLPSKLSPLLSLCECVLGLDLREDQGQFSTRKVTLHYFHIPRVVFSLNPQSALQSTIWGLQLFQLISPYKHTRTNAFLYLRVCSWQWIWALEEHSVPLLLHHLLFCSWLSRFSRWDFINVSFSSHSCSYCFRLIWRPSMAWKSDVTRMLLTCLLLVKLCLMYFSISFRLSPAVDGGALSSADPAGLDGRPELFAES